MSNIVFSRVDHRLIHGQVVTKWLKISQADTIIIVDNYLGQDPFMLDIYKMAAPSGVDIDILTCQDVANKYQDGSLTGKKIMLLFKNLMMVKEAVDNGLYMNSLQLGGIPHEEDRKVIIPAISLNSQELQILKDFHDKNINITAQVVPEEVKLKYNEIVNKF